MPDANPVLWVRKSPIAVATELRKNRTGLWRPSLYSVGSLGLLVFSQLTGIRGKGSPREEPIPLLRLHEVLWIDVLLAAALFAIVYFFQVKQLAFRSLGKGGICPRCKAIANGSKISKTCECGCVFEDQFHWKPTYARTKEKIGDTVKRRSKRRHFQ